MHIHTEMYTITQPPNSTHNTDAKQLHAQYVNNTKDQRKKKSINFIIFTAYTKTFLFVPLSGQIGHYYLDWTGNCIFQGIRAFYGNQNIKGSVVTAWPHPVRAVARRHSTKLYLYGYIKTLATLPVEV